MKYLYLFLCLGIYTYSYSQNTITGTVTDENNTPLFGVEIYIEKLHLGTTTDENGTFELRKIPKGQHEVSFQYLGFTTIKRTLTIPLAHSNINIILQESTEHIDEVLVSTPFQKLQSENVMKVEHESIESLRRNGGPTMMENLTAIPGVEQISTGTGIGKPVIRGLTGNRVLIYTQGVRLENQQFGSEHGLGLNQAGFDGVEIIKGPASLLYGSDALGGVLYFKPEKFALNNSTDVSIEQNFFSNTLGSNTTVGIKSSKEQLKFLARGTYNTHSDYQLANEERATNTRFNEKDFKAGVGFNTDFWAGELRYNFTNSKVGIPEEHHEQSKSKTIEIPYQDIDNHILSLHNHFYINDSKIDVNLGYIANYRKEFEDEHHHEDEDDHDHHDHHNDHNEEYHEEEHHGDEAALDMHLKTFTYEVKYYIPNQSKFETIIGAQGLHQTNRNHGEELLIPNAVTNDIGAFITSLYNLNENTSIQGGLRFDHRHLNSESFEVEDHDHHTTEVIDGIDKNFQSFNFSLGVKTHFFEQLTARFNFASGFRAPTLAELTSFGVHHGTNRFEIGNPNLDSEQNYQTDIALEFKSEHVEFFANGFYNKIDNYIFAEPSGDTEHGVPVYVYTQDDANLYGGELGVHFHPHPIDWLHIESSYETVVGKRDDQYLPLIPANKWANTFRSEFRKSGVFQNIFAAVQYNYYFEQDRVSLFEETTPGYGLFNIQSGTAFKLGQSLATINFGINNLFNVAYTSHLSALKPLQIQNPGRNFILGLKWEL